MKPTAQSVWQRPCGLGWLIVGGLSCLLFMSVRASESPAHSKKSPHAAVNEHESPPPAISEDEEMRQLLTILKDQMEMQPIETLRGIMSKIVNDRGADSVEGREALVLFRKALLLAARRSAQMGNHSEAIVHYERWRAFTTELNEFDPDLAPVFIEIGREYRALGSHLTAVETFYRAMTFARQASADPEVLRTARWEVAETMYLMKNWERARRLYDMFVDSDGQDDLLTHTAFYRIGDCWRAMGDEGQMILYYERALANQKDHPFAPEARLALLEAFLKRGNQGMAARVLKDFSEGVTHLSTEDILYWKKRSGRLLFDHLFQTQSYDDAIQILDGMSAMDKDSLAWQEQVTRWKGLLRMEKGDWGMASAFMDRSKQINLEIEKIAKEPVKEGEEPIAKNEPPVIPSSQMETNCIWIVETEKRIDRLDMSGIRSPKVNPGETP